MIFRVKYEVLGGHAHCALFAARQPNTTFAKCGDLTVRIEELPDLQVAMSGVPFIKIDSGRPVPPHGSGP